MWNNVDFCYSNVGNFPRIIFCHLLSIQITCSRFCERQSEFPKTCSAHYRCLFIILHCQLVSVMLHQLEQKWTFVFAPVTKLTPIRPLFVYIYCSFRHCYPPECFSAESREYFFTSSPFVSYHRKMWYETFVPGVDAGGFNLARARKMGHHINRDERSATRGNIPTSFSRRQREHDSRGKPP